jgi:HEAT repeat protein
VCVTLGQIGPGAFAAVPVLTELLYDEWWYVRENAAAALGHIGTSGERAQSALGQLLQDPNPDVRASASEALDRIKGAYHPRPSLQ